MGNEARFQEEAARGRAVVSDASTNVRNSLCFWFCGDTERERPVLHTARDFCSVTRHKSSMALVVSAFPDTSVLDFSEKIIG